MSVSEEWEPSDQYWGIDAQFSFVKNTSEKFIEKIALFLIQDSNRIIITS